MGKLASTFQSYLRSQLSESHTPLDWKTEHRIAGTPVDVVGIGDETIILIELEWRRADPADNSAKLFRHIDAGHIDQSRVIAIQIFTGYYNLASGGISSKRKNAEFIGHIAEDAIGTLTYCSVDFELEPPKRGNDWEEDWKTFARETISEISERIPVSGSSS